MCHERASLFRTGRGVDVGPPQLGDGRCASALLPPSPPFSLSSLFAPSPLLPLPLPPPPPPPLPPPPPPPPPPRCRALQTGLLGISVCLATAVRPRGGSQAAGDAPGLGAAAPSHAHPGRGVAARATCLCPRLRPLPQGARTAKLDLGADLGHRPRKPASDAEQRARHRLPESAAELSPVAGRAMGLALPPAPIARRRGLRGSGETRSLRPQAPAGGGKPVLARPMLHPRRFRPVLRTLAQGPAASEEIPFEVLAAQCGGEPRLARLCRPRGGPAYAADPAQWATRTAGGRRRMQPFRQGLPMNFLPFPKEAA